MAGRTIDVMDKIEGVDSFAQQIANQYQDWQNLRDSWLDEKRELRNYLFATDTTTTANKTLPWRNSTTRPKLTQIRDNLESNYMSALFPNDDWLTWIADDQDSAKKEKVDLIQSYMRSKTRPTVSPFREIMHSLVLDFIDYGNAFATTEYVNETRRIVPLTAEVEAEQNGDQEEDVPGYVGPMPVRISPLRIVFNPAAPTWDSSPKILRSVKSIGEVYKDLEERPALEYQRDILDLVKQNREKLKAVSRDDRIMSEGFVMDGFSDMHHYYSSNSVELLEFIGDIYDVHNDKLYTNHIITVIDRLHILRVVPNPTWRKNLIRHVGWRNRPDNLYAMGPLDNLVGLQYRIDHLENLKADAFDQIALPLVKIKGFVEDFDFAPGERIYTGEDGDVEFLRPETGVLQANLEIRELEDEMEMMAGAPKEAMGVRTPGEKTAFEFSRLDAAGARTFQRKINDFEVFMERILNDMLETSRRNMNTEDLVASVDNDQGTMLFQTITKADLTAKGQIFPIGARHFAAEANQLQNMVQFANSALGQDPSVKVHISGIGIAKAVERLLNFEKFNLVSKNVQLAENAESQQFAAGLERQLGIDEQLENEDAIAASEEEEGEDLDESELPLDEAPI